jgi:hypothetical protein
MKKEKFPLKLVFFFTEKQVIYRMKTTNIKEKKLYMR